MSNAPDRIIVSSHGLSYSVKATHTTAFKNVEYIRADLTDPMRDVAFLMQEKMIKQQAKQIAELEAAQQWISVEDRLPGDQEVIINYYAGVSAASHTDILKDDGDDGFVVVGKKWTNDEGLEFVGVTHWMPLPAPPQRIENE